MSEVEYFGNKVIWEKEDLFLTDEEKEIIKNFKGKMLADRILVMPLDVQPRIEGGIIDPHHSGKRREGEPMKRTSKKDYDISRFPIHPNSAVVVSVGPGYKDTHGVRTPSVVPGDVVAFDLQQSGSDALMIGDLVYMWIREGQIIAVTGNLL